MTHANECGSNDDNGAGCFVPWCRCSCHRAVSRSEGLGSWDGDWMPPSNPDAQEAAPSSQERIVTPSGKELPPTWLDKRVRVSLRSRVPVDTGTFSDGRP